MLQGSRSSLAYIGPKKETFEGDWLLVLSSSDNAGHDQLTDWKKRRRCTQTRVSVVHNASRSINKIPKATDSITPQMLRFVWLCLSDALQISTDGSESWMDTFGIWT